MFPAPLGQCRPSLTLGWSYGSLGIHHRWRGHPTSFPSFGLCELVAGPLTGGNVTHSACRFEMPVQNNCTSDEGNETCVLPTAPLRKTLIQKKEDSRPL